MEQIVIGSEKQEGDVGNVVVTDTSDVIARICRETRGGRYSRPTACP